jgi:hypothetical protein
MALSFPPLAVNADSHFIHQQPPFFVSFRSTHWFSNSNAFSLYFHNNPSMPWACRSRRRAMSLASGPITICQNHLPIMKILVLCPSIRCQFANLPSRLSTKSPILFHLTHVLACLLCQLSLTRGVSDFPSSQSLLCSDGAVASRFSNSKPRATSVLLLLNGFRHDGHETSEAVSVEHFTSETHCGKLAPCVGQQFEVLRNIKDRSCPGSEAESRIQLV